MKYKIKSFKKIGKKGFTLIELVIVIAVLAVLAMIMVPAIDKYLYEAKVARNVSGAKTTWNTAEMIEVENYGKFVDYDDFVDEIKESLGVVEPERHILVQMDWTTREVTKVAFTKWSSRGNEPMISFDGTNYEVMEHWGLD